MAARSEGELDVSGVETPAPRILELLLVLLPRRFFPMDMDEAKFCLDLVKLALRLALMDEAMVDTEDAFLCAAGCPNKFVHNPNSKMGKR